jgi:predicted AlkP superfamily phosphohydrolase/phosphomutase
MWRRARRRRFLVLGWDCASPELVFNAPDLPVITRLRQQGTWGHLQSSIPCITVPAWSSMLSSRDPGELGIYGFRNRTSYSYSQMGIADSTAVKLPRVWDYLGEAGLQSLVLGVPQTYPVQPINGHLVSGFMTPGTTSAFTYPAIDKQDVLRIVPDYTFDIRDFRTKDRQILLQQIMAMTRNQYRLLKHYLRHRDWDFAIHVNIGLDRMHHGFWRYQDPQHRLYEPDSPFAHAIRDYYRLLDAETSEILDMVGADTTILIVSDHGAKRMDGGICINEWLWREGWLRLGTPPPAGQITPLEDLDVDWSRTRAWGSGGYYGRVFLNVTRREPQGVIAPEDYEQIRNELAAALRTITGPQNLALNNQIFKPETIYQTVNGIAPDLMVYFGDLHWRAVGSLGHGDHFTLQNDTGPDDANHSETGLFILYEPGKRGLGQVAGHQLIDIAPTILHRMRVPVPVSMRGRVIGG